MCVCVCQLNGSFEWNCYTHWSYVIDITRTIKYSLLKTSDKKNKSLRKLNYIIAKKLYNLAGIK